MNSTMLIWLDLDLYYAHPAQPLTAAGDELDDLDHDISNLSEVWKLFSR